MTPNRSYRNKETENEQGFLTPIKRFSRRFRLRRNSNTTLSPFANGQHAAGEGPSTLSTFDPSTLPDPFALPTPSSVSIPSFGSATLIVSPTFLSPINRPGTPRPAFSSVPPPRPYQSDHNESTNVSNDLQPSATPSNMACNNDSMTSVAHSHFSLHRSGIVYQAKDVNKTVSPSSKFNYQETLLVLVGPEAVPFIIHKANVCTKSTFFEAACRNSWKEAQKKTVKLSEIHPWCFALYTHWVYSGVCELDLDTDFYLPSTTTIVTGEERLVVLLETVPWTAAFAAYVAGQFLGDAAFCGAVMSKLPSLMRKGVKAGKGWPHAAAVTYAWENTPEGSRMRVWLVRALAVLPELEFDKEVHEWPAGVVIEVSKLLRRVRFGRRPSV